MGGMSYAYGMPSGMTALMFSDKDRHFLGKLEARIDAACAKFETVAARLGIVEANQANAADKLRDHDDKARAFEGEVRKTLSEIQNSNSDMLWKFIRAMSVIIMALLGVIFGALKLTGHL